MQTQTAVGFLMNHFNAPEFEESQDEFTRSWDSVAYVMDKYIEHKATEISKVNTELLEALEEILQDANSADYEGGFSEASHIKAKAAIAKAKGLQST
jgi:hypothetical protein